MERAFLTVFLLVLSSGTFADDLAGPSRSSQAAKPVLPEAGPWRQITFLTDRQKAAGRTVGGEGGQQITSISWSASNPERIAFCVDVAGTWLSDDGGKSWKMRKGEMLSNKMQAGIAIDPQNANVIYAWSIGELSGDKWMGLHQSLDAGVSWTKTAAPANSPAPGWGQQRFAFLKDEKADKAFGRTACVFTCNKNEILMSKDGGQRFSPFGKELPESMSDKFHITNLSIAKTEPLTLLAGSTDGLFQVTAEATVRVGKRLPDHASSDSMAQHPQKPNIFWVVARKGLFKSMDYGETFEEIGIGFKFGSIFVSGADGEMLYNPVGYETIYFSHDGGTSWSPGNMDQSLCCRHSGGWAQGFATHPQNRLEALACFGDRLFATKDGGKTWSDSSTGWTGTRSVTRNSFYFHPTDKRVIGIGSLDWGFFYTVNGGDTWRYCWSQGVTSARSVYALLLDPRANWQALDGPQRILACSGTWNKQLLIRSEDGGAWKLQTEGKQTWNVYNDISNKGKLASYNAKHPGMVYMGQHKSLDWGMTWKEMPQPAYACCFSNPDILYSIRKYDDGYGLMRSIDCGDSWQELKGHLKNCPSDIEVAPDNPNVVYAACGGIAIWKGGEWKSVGVENGLAPDAFGRLGLSSIAIDPKRPERIYAGAWTDYFGNSNGVWASCDHGATWSNISCNLGPMSIWSIAVSPHDGSVYVGTSYGHWVLDRP